MELERVLLLVLGCAVQSDNKPLLIENIKQLDTDVQCAIVDSIQTVNTVSVLYVVLASRDWSLTVVRLHVLLIESTARNIKTYLVTIISCWLRAPTRPMTILAQLLGVCHCLTNCAAEC